MPTANAICVNRIPKLLLAHKPRVVKLWYLIFLSLAFRMPGKVGRYLLDTRLAALVDGPAVYIISPASPSSGNALPFSKA